MSLIGSTHPADRRSEKDDIGATNRAATSPVKDVTTYYPNKTKLFVGRLHPNTTKAELAAYFSRYGYVREVQVLTNRTNRNFGKFGFVTFADSGAISRNVLKTRHRLHGRYLNVQIAISTGQSHLGRTEPSIQDCSTQFGGVRDAKEAIDFVALADSEMARRRTPKTRDIPGDLNAKSDLCARP
nr:unnamed protein product [Spirometra erinaceieuropaei]